MANVDVFVGNEILIDADVYQLWLGGYTAHEAAQTLQKRGLLQQYGATFDMLLGETQDHYRCFSMLERYLKNPPMMAEQMQFQMAPDVRRMMIEKYYEFDSGVVRDILGKKLSSRTRNALDDISEKMHIPLRSCRRQFDNIRRVFKTVEEMKGSLVANIQVNFLLSNGLSEQYAAIMFIANNRFETGKKKLLYLSFADFALCANQMIANWSYSSKDCFTHEDMDVDIDRDFLMELRELKTLTDRDSLEEHKMLVVKSAAGKLSAVASVDLDNSFKNLSKTLLNIAFALNHIKELRDLFLDLVEKFVEPCRQTGWTMADVKAFLGIYKETSRQLDFFTKGSKQLVRVWDRYISTVASCLIQMYHT